MSIPWTASDLAERNVRSCASRTAHRKGHLRPRLLMMPGPGGASTPGRCRRAQHVPAIGQLGASQPAGQPEHAPAALQYPDPELPGHPGWCRGPRGASALGTDKPAPGPSVRSLPPEDPEGPRFDPPSGTQPSSLARKPPAAVGFAPSSSPRDAEHEHAYDPFRPVLRSSRRIHLLLLARSCRPCSFHGIGGQRGRRIGVCSTCRIANVEPLL